MTMPHNCIFVLSDSNRVICSRSCCSNYAYTNDPSKVVAECQCSFGLGDYIALITKWLRITQCNKCKKRQTLLNKWFPNKHRILIYLTTITIIFLYLFLNLLIKIPF